MSRSFEQPDHDKDGARPGSGLHTPDSGWVVLRVFYADAEPVTADQVDLRLRGLMQGTGVIPASIKDHIVLVSLERLLKPAEWTEVIAWLMSQPEVTFAVRVSPATTSGPG